MKRKALSLFVLIAVVTTLLFPVQAFATYDRDLERAISTAKAKISIPKTFDSFSYNIYRDNDQTVFNLTWEDTKTRGGSINLTINSSGRITNYNYYKPYYERDNKRLPVVNKNDALKIANNFLKKINPEFVNNIKYLENNLPLNINDRNYQFIYYRTENGVTFPENNMTVNVDSMTGDVQNYYCNWNENYVFPDLSGSIDIEKAKQAFAEKLGLKLVYKLNYDEKAQTPYLTYSTVYDNYFIDAKTGEVISANNFYGPNYANFKDGIGGMGGAGGAYPTDKKETLTPQEQDAVKSAGNLIDEKAAEGKARDVLNISSDYNLTNINLYNNWQNKDEYSWSMEFSKQQGEIYNNVSVTLDAKTGDILSFYKSLPYDEKASVKYTEDESKKIAEEFMKKLQPKKFAETEFTKWYSPIRPLDDKGQLRQSQFNYTRKVNDAYFIGNGFNVTVDNTTGQVISYNLTWYNKEIPNLGKTISLDDAYKILYDKVGFKIQYVSIEPESNDAKILPGPYTGRKRDIKLVYAVNPEKLANIDAYTGKLLDYNGKPVEKAEINNYTDIKGNFAENQIKILAEYGISLPGNQIKPNQKINQREFLYLLQKSIDPYITINSPDSTNDDVLYNSLTGMGIVKQDEKSPSSVVTREDAVKFIVRALNYDKVAEAKKPIFVLPFKDAKNIKPGMYGYVAIAYGLNIIEGNNGCFNPESNLTRAQAFALIYNFLNVH